MFPTSTQAKYWMFKNEETIQKIKLETNSSYIQR